MKLRILAAVICVTGFLCAEGLAQGFLRVSGTKIVAGSNGEIILRGIGLGNWLVPEGYMWQTSSFADSPTAIRNKIASLIGEANTEAFFQLYRSRYVRRIDVDRIAAWGFNSIRLPMHYNLLNPKNQPGVYLESGFAIIDSLLAWCEANRLYLILDLHCAIGGQNTGNISDYAGYPSLWESADYRQRTVDLWRKIAERYKDREWIGGYDLLNETAFDLGAGNVPLRNLMISITTAIREVDTNHIIFVEGNWYATDFSGLTPPWDANMVYSFHKYWNNTTTGTIQYLLDLRSSSNRPLWMGESGENSNSWFTDVIKMFEANGIGWSWWPHKKVESTSGLTSIIKPAGYDYLLKYWSGQVPAPTTAFAVEALTQFAVGTELERCIINTSVIDAMIRQVRDNSPKPFVPHPVPGIIFASDYDLGGHLSGYSDTDIMNISGSPGGSPWNKGGNYRNDGVDIETTTDFPSNGYNVGWIATGEWLNFTVDVEQTATYQLTARVAGGATGGKILFKVDGQIVNAFVDVPLTGGYQSWQTIDCGRINLTAGRHVFNSTFYFGGFNVNYFELTKVATSVSDESALPKATTLSDAFPNPFNPSTSFEVRLAKPERVTLTVVDVLGRPVAVLMNEVRQAGVHVVSWNASPFPSGVYYARLNSSQGTITKKLILQK